MGDCPYLLVIRSQVGGCPYLRTAGPVDAGVHQPLQLLFHLVQGVRRAVQSVPQPDAGLTRPHHPRAARVHPALLGCTATRAAGGCVCKRVSVYVSEWSVCVCCTHLFLFKFPLALVLVNELLSGFSLFLFSEMRTLSFCCCLFVFVVCTCILCLLSCLTRCSFTDVLSSTPTGVSEINYLTCYSRRRHRPHTTATGHVTGVMTLVLLWLTGDRERERKREEEEEEEEEEKKKKERKKKTESVRRKIKTAPPPPTRPPPQRESKEKPHKEQK